MLELRENIFTSGTDITESEIKDNSINRVVLVSRCDEVLHIGDVTLFSLPLNSDRNNPSHLKDLACHCPKYMCQNGDKVLIMDNENGFGAAAYIAARLVCEIEGKSIYDIFMEIKEKSPEFDIGQAYY